MIGYSYSEIIKPKNDRTLDDNKVRSFAFYRCPVDRVHALLDADVVSEQAPS